MVKTALHSGKLTRNAPLTMSQRSDNHVAMTPRKGLRTMRRVSGTHRSPHMRGCPRELIFQPFAEEGLLLVDGQVTSLNFRRH